MEYGLLPTVAGAAAPGGVKVTEGTEAPLVWPLVVEPVVAPARVSVTDETVSPLISPLVENSLPVKVNDCPYAFDWLSAVIVNAFAAAVTVLVTSGAAVQLALPACEAVSTQFVVPLVIVTVQPVC